MAMYLASCVPYHYPTRDLQRKLGLPAYMYDNVPQRGISS